MTGVRRDAPRVVILTASVGAGHLGPAREIARRLESNGCRADLVDLVDLGPAGLGRALRALFHLQLRLGPRSWGAMFDALDGDARWPRLVDLIVGTVARRAAAVLAGSADVSTATLVVSTFPLGGLVVETARRHGPTVPLVTYITDPAAHRLWTAGTTDLYLVTSPATPADIWRWGPAAISIVPAAVAPGFRPPVDRLERDQIRRRLGLPDGPLALVTSGSWGVGEVAASAADLRDTCGVTPVVVCGHNHELHRKVGDMPGVIAIGWTDRMPDIMRACDVAVLNSGGLTLAEAAATGLPVVHYRPLPGQGVANAVATAAHGQAYWARIAVELPAAVAAALGQQRPVSALGHRGDGRDALVEHLLAAGPVVTAEERRLDAVG